VPKRREILAKASTRPRLSARDAYEEAVDWVYASLNARGHLSSGAPDRVRRFPTWTRALLDALGAPDAAVESILVTGSKGKGSTCLLAAAALQAATSGPVGLTVSPHLLEFRERIRIRLRSLSPSTFAELVQAVRPVADALERRMPLPAYRSPVGTAAVLAALHFARQGVRYAVHEVGRGGEMDDVTQLRHRVAVWTALLPEHLRELGPTVEDIARHKAGVVTPDTHTVVVGELPPFAMDLVAARAREVGARLLCLGKDVRVHAQQEGPGIRRVTVSTPGAVYRDLPLPLQGPYQAGNLAMALAAAEALLGRPLPPRRLGPLLGRLRWPGRLEVVPTAHGTYLLDCSIEPGAARAALGYARRWLKGPYACVLGVPRGKAYRPVWDAVTWEGLPTCITRALNPYLSFPSPEEADAWAQEDPQARAYLPSLEEALKWARGKVGAQGTVVVLGTVSLIADALRALGQNAHHLFTPDGKERPRAERWRT
jgi:dihydrofolate synthase/folylpolyglutamate synthase